MQILIDDCCLFSNNRQEIISLDCALLALVKVRRPVYPPLYMSLYACMLFTVLISLCVRSIVHDCSSCIHADTVGTVVVQPFAARGLRLAVLVHADRPACNKNSEWAQGALEAPQGTRWYVRMCAPRSGRGAGCVLSACVCCSFCMK